MKNVKLYSGALAITAAMLVSPFAASQEMEAFEPEQDNINLIGLGILSVPDFYGSDKTQGAAAPIFRYSIKGGNRYVQLLGSELTLNLVDRKDWRAGPILRVRARRDDDVDDAIVKQMRPIASAPELGAFVAYNLYLDNNKLHKVVFSGDIVGNTNSVYTGASGNLRVNYYYPFPQTWAKRLTVGQIGLGMFFASDNFNRTYFGVNGSDIALFPSLNGVEYDPSGGLTSVKIPFSITTVLDQNKKWLLTVGGRYEHLLGDAKDSPVVDQRGNANQWAAGLAISYVF